MTARPLHQFTRAELDELARTRSLLEQRDGGDVIDTRLHRATPIHQPPLPDSAHEHRLEEAEKRERDARITRRNWAICDAVTSFILVLFLALLIGGAR